MDIEDILIQIQINNLFYSMLWLTGVFQNLEIHRLLCDGTMNSTSNMHYDV